MAERKSSAKVRGVYEILHGLRMPLTLPRLDRPRTGRWPRRARAFAEAESGHLPPKDLGLLVMLMSASTFQAPQLLKAL